MLSYGLPLLMQVPESLPSTAMGSALLLYLERVLAAPAEEPAEQLTRAQRLRLIDEALARQLEARKRFFVALERLEKRAR